MRMSNFTGFATTSITAAVIMAMSAYAHAETFIANDIAIDGLQRVTVESLQTTLPIHIGQSVTDELLADSIRALYATEHFSNVQADVQGDRVVFYVTERPVIAELNFEGNKLIPKAGLEEGLKTTGLMVGNVLKQSTVNSIENELKTNTSHKVITIATSRLSRLSLMVTVLNWTSNSSKVKQLALSM